VGSALEAIKRKGYFKTYKEFDEAYVEHWSRVKLAKAQLAKLDDSTDKEAGPPKKSTTKSNVNTAEASQADPALQAKLMSEIKQAQEAADMAKTKKEQAAVDIFQLYGNLLSVDVKYLWNKIVHEKLQVTPIQTSNAVPRKDQGDFPASCLMTVCYSTFSPCSPITRLSKSSTTYRMCSRCPNKSAFIYLYSMCSSSTLTLHSCLAGTTAQAPSSV
jgi:hypothetical protein